MTKKSEKVDKYISTFPSKVQKLLEKLRSIISQAAPNAEELINYGIPTYKLKGVNLVHFAAYTKQIGFYPTPSGITKFKKELSSFKTEKGLVQFPLDRELPLKIVKDIVKFRVKEVEEKR